MSDVAKLAEAYIDAYNSKDMDALASMLTENVHIIHHNRGVEVTGRDNAVALYEGYGQAVPDRAFADRKRLDVLADGRVLIEHTWSGTAAADIPGWASSGEKLSLDICTFLTFDGDKVADYHDFG